MVRARPHRLPRHLYCGERTCAFTACTQGRRTLFTKQEIVEALIPYLAKAAEQNKCVVPIYCFMPDHLHVMFQGLSEGSDTLEAMIKFKLLSGLWFDRKGFVGWQENFYDHVVRGSKDWRHHATYIAENPVRRGLVDNPFRFPLTGTIGGDLQDVILGWE